MIERMWGKAFSLFAVVMLAVSGCSSSVANADGDRTITETLNGQQVRFDPAGGRAKGLAIWFHGQGGDANTRMNQEWLNQLRVEGWAVASSDFHRNAWGNADAVADTAALVQWAAEKAGHPDRTLFVAGSMGARNSLAYMAGGGAAPDCWYGTMPVVDLEHVSNVPDADRQIAAAYPGTAPKPLELSKLPDAKYRVLASPADTWVPKAQNADVLVSVLQASKREVSTLTVSGEHGHPSHFSSADLAEFASSCLA